MSPRDAHAGMLDPQGCGSLHQFLDDVLAPAAGSTGKSKHFLTALNHFARALGKTPAHQLALADLTTGNLTAALELLQSGGMTAGTANRVRQDLLAIGRQAHARELLDAVPRCPAIAAPARRSPEPWSPSELERILASARAMPGDVAGVDARTWWPALVSVLLETGLSVANLLSVPKENYSPRSGTFVCGMLGYQLQSRAVEALDPLRFHEHARLFPWPFDGGKPPFYMLLRKYRELLYRVDLPHVTTNMFDRLRVTARRSPGILATLDLTTPVQVHAERLKIARARDSRPQSATDRKSGRKPCGPEVYRIRIDGPRTLKAFFESSYRPQRLADATEATAEQYRDAIEFLAEFLGCDPTVDCLSDDLVERFLAFRKGLGLSNATLNRYRCYLLALWRHGWRKRLIVELPRDVMRYTVSKRLPEAWSTEEVSRILTAAAATPGAICGIPAGLYWVALILTLYDTGLRISALMDACSRYLTDDGWLSIPAEDQKQDADQAFRLHPDTVAAILATDVRSREMLFPFHALDRKHVMLNHYRKILVRAGLPRGRRDLFHKLRRTCATVVCDAHGQLAAQRHLGHSSVEMTRRYIDPRKLTSAHSLAETMTRPAFAPPTAGEGGEKCA